MICRCFLYHFYDASKLFGLEETPIPFSILVSDEDPEKTNKRLSSLVYLYNFMEIETEYARGAMDKFKIRRGSVNPWRNLNFSDRGQESLHGAVKPYARLNAQNRHEGINQVPVVV